MLLVSVKRLIEQRHEKDHKTVEERQLRSRCKVLKDVTNPTDTSITEF